MAMVTIWRNGQAVEIDEAEAGLTSGIDLDAYADRIRDELLEGDLKMKALAMVIADLAVASGAAADTAAARQLVRNRFRLYFRQLLG